MTNFQLEKTVDKPNDNCWNDKIKSLIVVDENDGSYTIPRNLLLENLPESVVDSFLDFVNTASQGYPNRINMLLEMIKKGEITVMCFEDE